MIPIRPKFSPEAIRKYLNEEKAKIRKAIFSTLQRAGETFIIEARSKADFTDRTGNLRNSIGYAIYYNGKLMADNFVKGSDGDAISKSRAMINRLLSTGNVPKTGYVLICLAGMEYAAAVEAKGYDVITNSSVKVKAMLEQAVRSLKSKL